MTESTASDRVEIDISAPIVIGFGVTGQAVAAALLQRGYPPVVVDDRPSESGQAAASELGVSLIAAPNEEKLTSVLGDGSVLLPSPGVPDHHLSFKIAESLGLPIASEFDLAQCWDSRPLVAVTGTNGKTTVTNLVTEALLASNIPAVSAGNTDVPLVEAIEDSTTEAFVVEASSFRLGHSARFTPTVACWLNFAPDHLDAHSSLESYQAAKASIWSHPDTGVAIANADDEVVLNEAPPNAVLFSANGADAAQWRVDGSQLVGPEGPFVEISQLQRSQPHDLANALAVAAVASHAGASMSAIVDTLCAFTGFDHRLQFVGEWDGIGWFDDSKATVPHATLSAVQGFDSVVLIAGGRNKGLDLGVLRQSAPPVRSVVAIGEASAEIEEAFADVVPVERASSMADAVASCANLAESGDAVVLSPGCASFDWYRSYSERGLDFAALVRTQAKERMGA